MAKKQISIYLDPYANTLNMWWGDPNKAFISEEAEDSTDVIVFDKNKHPIGLEKIGFFPEEIEPIKYISGHSQTFLKGTFPLLKNK